MTNAAIDTINLLTRDNGAGLSRDLDLLQAVLFDLGHRVERIHLRRRALLQLLGLHARAYKRGWLEGEAARRADLNLALERIDPRYFGFARRNVLIPNPEWFALEQKIHLPRFDRIFVKTRHAQDIFSALGGATTYIGFTSPDRWRKEIPRENHFLHIAGRSSSKGTQTLLDTWTRHPHWPRLTVIWRVKHLGALPQAANIVYRRGYVDDAELLVLQNVHRFHLCPSETEGYGHYLVEALGVGAIVLTLDAPPMHELIDASRGLLIPAKAKGTQGLATTYGYTAADFAAVIEQALLLSDEQKATLSTAARAWFEVNDREFPRRLAAALATLD